MTNEKKTKLITPTFRVSFPAVFTPRKANEGDPNAVAKYSVQMIFPKTTDLTELKNAVRAAVVEKWGADFTLHIADFQCFTITGLQLGQQG